MPPKKKEPIVEKEPKMKAPVVEKPVVEKPKKSNKWIDEIKECSKKDNISYKEAMRKCSLIRKQGKDTKS